MNWFWLCIFFQQFMQRSFLYWPNLAEFNAYHGSHYATASSLNFGSRHFQMLFSKIACFVWQAEVWPLKYACTVTLSSSVDATLQSKINSQIPSKPRAFRRNEHLMLSDHGIPQEWKNLLGWGREEGRWQRTRERTQLAMAGFEDREMASQSMIKGASRKRKNGRGRMLLCWHLDSAWWEPWWTALTVTLVGSRINWDMGSGHGCGAQTWLLASWLGQGILKCAWQSERAEH